MTFQFGYNGSHDNGRLRVVLLLKQKGKTFQIVCQK